MDSFPVPDSIVTNVSHSFPRLLRGPAEYCRHTACAQWRFAGAPAGRSPGSCRRRWLLAIDEPCTVYVEGKTGDPYPMHMKETLMSSTQWQWLIKDSSGKYRPSGKYVNMTAYQAMGISKRGLILNHKDCRLEVHVSGKGQWSVASFRVVDTPITFSGIFWPIFFMVAIFAVTVPLIIRGINAPPARNQPRQWQPSKTLLAAYFLSELFKDNGKKK